MAGDFLRGDHMKRGYTDMEARNAREEEMATGDAGQEVDQEGEGVQAVDVDLTLPGERAEKGAEEEGVVEGQPSPETDRSQNHRKSSRKVTNRINRNIKSKKMKSSLTSPMPTLEKIG